MKYEFKILILFFFILINMNNINYAKSNNISNIDFEANINEDGTVDIIEIWKGEFYLGTEIYTFYENLTLDDISNFCIMENGVRFEDLDTWNIIWSQNEKKGKSSIIQTNDGIELTWGIGDFGYHEYKLKYTIKNIFKNNELNLKILDLNYISIQNVKIKVKGKFKDTAFADFQNCEGNLQVNSGEILCDVTNKNENINIYVNYDGLNNSLKKDNIIKIIANNNYRLFFILKKWIITLTFLIFLIISILLMILKKTEKYEFKPF